VYLRDEHADSCSFRSRLGISVPKKVGNAVQRNRIKRIIREAFRLHNGIFPQGSDIVFAVRPGFSFTGMQAVCDAVARLTRPGRGVE
jgi:ribonuclease P protein component